MIELMIVIAIMALVMTVGIPSFYRSMEKDAIRQATKVILEISRDARAQAIISGLPHDLIIQPGSRMLSVVPAQVREKTEEEILLEEAEQMARELEASEKKTEQKKDPGGLPDGIAIEFVGVNFVPDLQKAEEVRVRFYPNGTGDEFTMLIRSDRNDWRQFTMDVAVGILKWEVIR